MTVEKNLNGIKDAFSSCDTPQKVYAKIMELGREQTPLSAPEKNSENLVRGCQSELYLITEIRGEQIYFRAYADALISAGLAQILIRYYNGLTPLDVLKKPPTFLEELQIPGSLTPSRANGLYSVHLRMKQEALKHMVQASSTA